MQEMHKPLNTSAIRFLFFLFIYFPASTIAQNLIYNSYLFPDHRLAKKAIPTMDNGIALIYNADSSFCLKISLIVPVIIYGANNIHYFLVQYFQTMLLS